MTLVTERNFSAVMERLSKPNRLVVDTETTGLYTWFGAKQIGVSVAPPGAPREHCYYFPFRHKPGGNLSPKNLRQLVALLSKKQKTAWNGKFDAHMLMQDGMKEPWDDMENVDLLLHLVDENQHKAGGSYELKISAERYIDKSARHAQLRLTELLADRGLTKGDLAELSPAEVDEYASDDVFYTERLRERLLPAAQEWEVDDLWPEINRYAMVTRRMEARGFLIDRDLTRKYIEECDANLARLKRKLDRMAGRELNLRSYPQMQSFLELPSTAQDYIDEIEWKLTGRQRKAVALLQEYRKWDRAKGSYYEPFLRNVDESGAYHPSIKLHGTISGRPSTTGTPNPFAIPRSTEIYKVKNVIVARKGYVLINADYSQAELRLGAHYSGDEFNIKCFQEGKSPHKLLMADLIEQGVDISYDNTKRVSFGVQYGTGAPTLAKELKKDVKFAQRVLQAAHALHPNYRPMLKQTETVARTDGFIRLWTGRVRRFNTLPDPKPWFHKACSNIIQGGVGEVMRHAITRLSDILPQWDAHMLLQVYDSILFEVPVHAVKKLIPIIRREMTRDFPFKVPMEVEIKVGRSWGEVK